MGVMGTIFWLHPSLPSCTCLFMHAINVITATVFRGAVHNESFKLTICWRQLFVYLSYLKKKNALKMADDSTHAQWTVRCSSMNSSLLKLCWCCEKEEEKILAKQMSWGLNYFFLLCFAQEWELQSSRLLPSSLPSPHCDSSHFSWESSWGCFHVLRARNPKICPLQPSGL